jgi:hypothetical protein
MNIQNRANNRKGTQEMSNELTILWTNADPITAQFMVFMYAGNAVPKGWWDKVRIIVWGATTKLVAENKEIQEELLDLKSKGVQVEVCIACAKKLGVAEELAALGLDLKFMGEPLTGIIKSDGKLITI